MRILEEASRGAAPPESLSTHPSTGNRVSTIEDVIRRVYPEGLPAGLTL